CSGYLVIGVGPFSIQLVLVVVAVVLAWVTARSVAKRLPDVPHKAAGSMVLDAVFWGFVAGRAVYIAQWWEEYSAAPISMIVISDGGFAWWAGVPAALAYLVWRTRRTPSLRGPVVSGVVA